jgi:hypothetical protein
MIQNAVIMKTMTFIYLPESHGVIEVPYKARKIPILKKKKAEVGIVTNI